MVKLYHRPQRIILYPLCLIFSLMLIACNGSNDNDTFNGGGDTAPGVVLPPAHDTSAVITPPPTGDSNVVIPESQGNSR